MGNAKFVISLDFELKWGVFDALDDSYDSNILKVHEAVPRMLELFEKYNIQVTWATVGLLFNQNKNDYEKYKPKRLPSYTNKSFNPYESICIGEDESSDKLHYANSLIKKILEYSNHEIASHSYSHYNALADGQTIEEFEDDLKSAVTIAKDKYNIDIQSYVFAKNEVNYDYIQVLKKHGIKIFRSNPDTKIYKKGQRLNLIEKVVRLADSYINITGNYNSHVEENGVFSIQGDRFLRPYRNSLLNSLMIRRVKNEMLEAAKNNRVYHLWWHPHNFGSNLNQNLETIETLFKYYHVLKNQYNMESKCMRDLI